MFRPLAIMTLAFWFALLVQASEVISSLTCLRQEFSLNNTGRRGLFGGELYQIRSETGSVQEVFTHKDDAQAAARFQRVFCEEYKRAIERERFDP